MKKLRTFTPTYPKMFSFELITGSKYSLLFIELFYFAIEIRLDFIKIKKN